MIEYLKTAILQFFQTLEPWILVVCLILYMAAFVAALGGLASFITVFLIVSTINAIIIAVNSC